MPQRFFPALLCVSLVATGARALDAEVEASTFGQFYGLRAFNGESLRDTRVSQYLRLNLANVVEQNRLYFTANLRLDSNTALSDAEIAEIGMASEYRRASASLQWAVLGGRGIGGFLDFAVGRQVAIDSLDFFVFDGLRLTLNTPWRFGVELLGGVQVRGNSPLGYSPFQPWGTAESEGTEVAPVFGVAIFARDLRWAGFRTDARASWRRVFNGAIIEERVGGHAEQLVSGVLTVYGGATYNLVFDGVDEATAGARVRLLDSAVQIEAEYFRANPRFDADSIWNVFSFRASDDVRLKLGFNVTARLELFARGLVRFFSSATATGATESAFVTDVGASVGARFVSPPWRSVGYVVGGEASIQRGFGGDRNAIDAYVILNAWQRRLLFDARATFVNAVDDLQARRNASLVGVLIGGSYRVLRGTSLGVACETIGGGAEPLFRLTLALESSLAFWDDPVDLNRSRAVGTTP